MPALPRAAQETSTEKFERFQNAPRLRDVPSETKAAARIARVHSLVTLGSTFPHALDTEKVKQAKYYEQYYMLNDWPARWCEK